VLPSPDIFLQAVVQGAAWTFVGLNIAISLYGFIIGLRGLQPIQKPPRAAKHRRFAIVIPAHNEARVLAPLLESLRAQRYPADCFDVFVSADNCSDDTAGVARSYGATALERFDTSRRGKSWNLKWAFHQIPLPEYDSLICFDADNLVDAEFLSAMNDHLEAHPEADVLQGYLDVKNPDDSWVTRAYAVSYWFSNRFGGRARTQWKLPSVLGGTGLLIRTSTLLEVGWNVESLTDDLEFSMQLILAGKCLQWNDFAVTYDEKPVTITASYRQRVRWMQGHFWVLGRYGWAMLKRFVTSRNPTFLEAWVYLFTPARNLLGLLFVLTQLFSGHYFEAQGGTEINYGNFALTWAGTLLVTGTLQLLIAPFMRFGRIVPKYLLGVVTLAFFGLTWIPILIRGLITSNQQGDWVKTEHTRAVTVGELERES
jgi:cellulose synthase/poly-beta-1,6-N-acetylglucosamine synthase-like glycosyltransferase